MKALSYRQQVLNERWDAIVVGSGIGGMAAASLLSVHAGKKVLVLERHYEVGGYTHVFHRTRIPMGRRGALHWAGTDRASLVRQAFDHVTGGQLEWAALPEVYDRAVISGRTYDFVSGLERFRARMKEYFPQDAAAVDRYIAAVLSASKASKMYFAEKAIPRVAARLAGGLMRSSFLRWAGRTTAEVLDGITDNRELKGVLTAHGPITAYRRGE